MKTIYVVKSDFDRDFCWECPMTVEEAFSSMASLALDYLEEEDNQFDYEDESKRVIAAIQSEDIDQLLGPVNEYLYNFNGENFIIEPTDAESNYKERRGTPIPIDGIRKRILEVAKRIE